MDTLVHGGVRQMLMLSMLAHDYFTDSNAGGSIVDPDSECQLNYVM